MRARRWQRHLATTCLVLGGSLVSPLLAADASQRWEGEAVGIDAPRSRFRWRVDLCGPRIRTEWRDTHGVVVAWDEVIAGPSGFARYRMMRQSGALSYRAAHDGDVVKVESWRRGQPGNLKQVDVDDDSVFAGPMLISLVLQSLSELRAGRELIRSYLVPEQGMVLRLSVRRLQYDANGGVHIVIRAASPLLRPFVPATVLEFDGANRLVRSSGRILPLEGAAEMTTTAQPNNSGVETECEF